MTERGKYIYGIINSNTSLHLSIPTDFLVGKSESNGVYTIPYQDISALVRDSEIVEYTGMRKDALARLLIGHQTVIERIMTPQTTIIPVRLGTYALDETEVKEILNKGYNLIKHIFEKISDKIEIDVAATWSNFNLIVKEVGEQKEIKEFKVRLLAEPKGITVEDQMKVGVMVKKALDERREKYAQEIQEALKTVSPDFKTHELMDDKMVVNIVLLIDKDKREGFDKKVEELNVKFNEKLNFRCVGPLPPYSFFTLEIKKMRFNDVAWARKRLGILNDAISKDEIKKIFQRQAFVTHPDKNPDRPEAEKEFDEIKKSYQILLDYAYSCEQGGRESIIFNEDEFQKNAILVKVRD